MKSFSGKVAAITGAGSGMGRELAIELAKRGCHLALSDINEAGLADTVTLLAGSSVRVTTQRLDVAERAAVHAWADQVAAEHGKVNLIFNNAGVALGSTVEGMSYADFEWLMNINFWGVVHGTKAFLPHLRRAGEGHVINLSSLFGIAAIPTQSAYNASKFAVRGFTESLRQELEMSGPELSATSVHPGGIKTNIARSARFADNLKGTYVRSEAEGKQQFEKMFITSANRAACIILRAVERNKRRVLVGPDATALDLLVRLLPALYQRFIMWGTRRTMRAA
ncbi:MAG TPA: SDR family NAD(P)-dependent oxidoreductase [Solimonas sp.]|nr:SDR family NAD(P)-dependent oxidoreductase [Solimonas sp.]